MSFRDYEKKRLVKLKSQLFSIEAQPKGLYRKNRYDFCLQEKYADENIYKSFSIAAKKYFSDRKINWHDGNNGLPSNHLCCSQSACINFLFPYRFEPELLKNVLIEVGYPVKEVLPFFADKFQDIPDPFVAFEWIGIKNYLKELSRGKIASDIERSRGKGFTSADFAILFRRTDDKTQLILGEWKYTEEYRGKGSIQFSSSNTNRLDNIYLPFLLNNSPINISPLIDYSILFYDPFDQLMRLQLLAKQMELSIPKELKADIVTVLHLVPKANKELMYFIPNQELKQFGSNIHEVWSNISEPHKFRGFYCESLVEIVTSNNNSSDLGWSEYIKTRYNYN